MLETPYAWSKLRVSKHVQTKRHLPASCIHKERHLLKSETKHVQTMMRLLAEDEAALKEHEAALKEHEMQILMLAKFDFL